MRPCANRFGCRARSYMSGTILLGVPARAPGGRLAPVPGHELPVTRDAGRRTDVGRWGREEAAAAELRNGGVDTGCDNTYTPSMTPSLRDEIRQKRPFQSLEQEAYLNVVRTAAALSDDLEQLLRPVGITAAQYNVLRILNGADAKGLCRNELRDRMLTRMPDMTRLLDRMERAGLVRRTRSEEDRRQVGTQITAEGRRILEETGELIREEHRRRLGHLSAEQLKSLIELLTLMRQAA